MLSEGSTACQSPPESTLYSNDATVVVRSTSVARTCADGPLVSALTSPIAGGVLSTTTGSLTRDPARPVPGTFAASSDATTLIAYRPSATPRVSHANVFSLTL